MRLSYHHLCSPVGPWRSWARAIFKLSRVFGLGFLFLRASLLQPSHVNPVLQSVNKIHLLGKVDFGDLLTGGFWSPPALCASLAKVDLPPGSRSSLKTSVATGYPPHPCSQGSIQAEGSPPCPCPTTQPPLCLLWGGVRSLTPRDLQRPVSR